MNQIISFEYGTFEFQKKLFSFSQREISITKGKFNLIPIPSFSLDFAKEFTFYDIR
jgi:hypothetical protein